VMHAIAKPRRSRLRDVASAEFEQYLFVSRSGR
jgi:hypothetical protein